MTTGVGVVAALLVAASSVPAFAVDSPGGVSAPLTANGADVVPGTVTESPSASPQEEAAAGADSETPLEEDLPIPGQADGPDLPTEPKTPMADYCGHGKYFVHITKNKKNHITKNKKNTMSVKYATYVKNKKSYPIDFKFTSKKSGTTKIGASVTISSEFKVMWLGKIEVEVNGNVEKSWTSELGIEAGGKVKAKSTVYGDYGIMKENVAGYSAYRYSNCQIGQKKNMTVWAP
ncbi:hypothetical protein [Streptomyces thermocarboxydovorans]|uniref:hypothetical protein n=1 Tax=Streptomyces thermocarboxydovorans TaxID=59298 RepID=UPI0031D06DDC